MKGTHPAPRAVGWLQHYGFTVVELLAILAVLALLIALRLPTLTRAERGTKIAQCAGNLRQFTLAMVVYADENKGNLPNNNAGFWAWDLQWFVGDQMDRFGADWRKFYCPGTGPRFSDADNFELYNFSPLNFHVIGYVLTLPNTFGVASSNWNPTLTPPPPPIGFSGSARPLPSERVLFADATISASGQSTESLRYTYNYTTIQGGFIRAHVSPHLSGSFPLGGNVSLLDGHVEWRKFPDMHPRTTGTSPVFWW